MIEAIAGKLKKEAHLGSSKNEKISVQNELAAVKRKFKKQEEKFNADLITMSELKVRAYPLLKEIKRLEARLESIDNSPSSDDYVKGVVSNVYAGIDELLKLSEWTNAQVKKVIDKITVSEDGAITVYLISLRRLGLEEPIAIEGDAIPPTTTAEL